MIQLKLYTSCDCSEILTLFYDTVHTVNQADYTKSQLDAWAPQNADLHTWDEKLKTMYTLLAVKDNHLAGFGSITPEGYLDLLYVHKDHQGEGIGTQLCHALEQWAEKQGAREYTVHASITAKPFFESQGYTVKQQQTVTRRGETLTNFIMEK
ncbi:MAG: GNAT family N-acetyltransferase [Massiliimalia sp.]|jgi:putative acetyltransferase